MEGELHNELRRRRPTVRPDRMSSESLRLEGIHAITLIFSLPPQILYQIQQSNFFIIVGMVRGRSSTLMMIEM
ncbi:hypothetical protein CHARACLAT_016970 [Characodon lateralis]|uniref:Uncharacterized protein n=1 Tax=Characodon lateralis TaxID=208331 RepID=A0ABU7CYB8_9TELE|nr:hypothetical protein [Characodon lateralis]